MATPSGFAQTGTGKETMEEIRKFTKEEEMASGVQDVKRLPPNNRGFSKPATAVAKADTGAMEAINGWHKDELFSDFSLNESEDVEESVRAYVEYFNERRPAFALGYLTPKQFTEKFYGSWQGVRKGEAAASGE